MFQCITVNGVTNMFQKKINTIEKDTNGKMKPNKKNLERISKSITPIKFSENKFGKYLNYCNFHYHPGVIGNIKAKECQNRKCNHYIKFIQNQNDK